MAYGRRMQRNRTLDQAERLQVVEAALTAPSSSPWLFLQVERSNNYAGNDGYPDHLGVHYCWDSTVQQARAVRVRNVAILWRPDGLLGVGVIERIEIIAGSKLRYRCPVCASTKIKERNSLHPRFRCANQSCRMTFEERGSESIEIDVFKGIYHSTWIDMEGFIDGDQCRALAIRQRSQHSIRPANPDPVLGVVSRFGKR